MHTYACLKSVYTCIYQAGDGVHIRHIETVELPNDGSGLGFGIIGSRNSGVVIKTILGGGVADKVSEICSKSMVIDKKIEIG